MLHSTLALCGVSGVPPEFQLCISALKINEKLSLQPLFFFAHFRLFLLLCASYVCCYFLILFLCSLLWASPSRLRTSCFFYTYFWWSLSRCSISLSNQLQSTRQSRALHTALLPLSVCCTEWMSVCVCGYVCNKDKSGGRTYSYCALVLLKFFI